MDSSAKVLLRNKRNNQHDKADAAEYCLEDEHRTPDLVLQIQVEVANHLEGKHEIVEQLTHPLKNDANESVEEDKSSSEIGNKTEPSTSHSIEDDSKDQPNAAQGWTQNWRQFTSVIPGTVYLLSFGIQFTLCLCNSNKNSAISNNFEWYLGAMLGSFIGAMFVSSFKKTWIYLISGIMLVTSGVLFLFGPHYVLGRILFGVTFGLVQLTVLVHVSDIAVKEMRSAICRKIVYLLAFSSLIFIVFFTLYGRGKDYNDIKVEGVINSVTGLLLIILGAVGMILTPILTNETVPYLLLRGKESKALEQLTRLCSEQKASRRTLQNFEELKLAVNEDKVIGSNIFANGNLRPLFVIVCVRLVGVMLWNTPETLSVFQQYTYSYWFFPDYQFMVPIVHANLLVVVGISAVFVSSYIGGDRLFYYVQVINISFLLTTSGVDHYFGYNSLLTQIERTATILFAVISAIGVNVSVWTQSAQAFSVLKKPWSIAVVAQFEYILHITIMIITDFRFGLSRNYYVGYSYQFISLILPIVLIFMLPKTTKLSLRDGRDELNKLSKRKFRNNDQMTKA